MSIPTSQAKSTLRSVAFPAARTGEYVAFERLYRENADRIFALCQRMAGDRARATEIAQEVFVRAWRQRRRARREADSATWLWHLAVDVVLAARLDEHRRGARIIVHDDAHERTARVYPSLPARGIDLDRAMQSIPARARAIYVLHDVEGYTVEEVADLMTLDIDVVRDQLHGARAVMREALAQ